MLFHSTIFLLLFGLIYVFYWFVPLRIKHFLIILTSFLFYLWYSIPFMLMFLFLSILNYLVANVLVERKIKIYLILVLVLDGSVLLFFKYFYLFASSIGYLIHNDYLIHIKENLIKDYQIEIVMPIAISFYTFQIIAYVVDCYRGVIKEKISFDKFIVFILFFPQFVAGPILRSTDFIPQIDNPIFDKKKINIGILLILQGVFKKVLIADVIGYYLSPFWSDPEGYHSFFYWLSIYGFIVQVYADFSGYTDMARGMSKLLGYEIPENFRGPLISRSISDLWNRWHITLSSWLRDYIYISLGGSRRGELRTYINLIITMAIGGLWHGATWNMLLWGIIMGFYLSIERFFMINPIKIINESSLTHFIRWVWTLTVFSFIAIFFATPNLESAFEIIQGILIYQEGKTIQSYETILFLILLGLFFNYLQYNRKLLDVIYQKENLQYFIIISFFVVLVYLMYLYHDLGSTFIYFAF